MTAVIDGVPTVFETNRMSGETDAKAAARLTQKVVDYVKNGSFSEWTETTWEWS